MATIGSGTSYTSGAGLITSGGSGGGSTVATVAWWRPSTGTVSPVISPPSVPTITGIDPTELANATYGKVIPIFAGGKARIGASIIFGPYFNTVNSEPCASFGVSFGFPANPEGTRVLKEIALDSTVVWESSAGTATISSGTFLGDTFTARFYQGTYTQAADPLEIEKWGTNAVAYRPQMVLFFENLPLTDYGNKIPFVAAVIGDTTDAADPDDGINLGDVLERLAYSPWVGMSTDTFETDGIQDVVGSAIFAEDQSFIDMLSNFNRVYRNWNVLQTDKLKVEDRGSDVPPDIILGRSRILNTDVSYQMQEPLSVAREIELITIDPDADYMLLPATAKRPKEPYAVSGSAGKEVISLPIVTDAETRQAMVTYVKYAEERARRRLSLTAMAYGLRIEPGDYVGLNPLMAGLSYDMYRVIETLYGANHTVRMTLESVMGCPPEPDEHFAAVRLLLGYNDFDGSTTFVDESLYNKTVNGDGGAQMDTAQAKFGESSCLFDGSDDVMGVTSYDADFNLPSIWTFECFIRFASTSGDQAIFGTWFPPVHGYLFRFTAGSLDWFCVGGTDFSAAWTPSVGVWYHVAIDRDGTTTRIYVNGVRLNSTTGVQDGEASSPTAFGIGAQRNAGAGTGRPFNGWIDEFRYTYGVARYATDAGFTAPTHPFPRTDGTID